MICLDGSKVKAARKKAGLTQAQVDAECGFGAASSSWREARYTNAKVDTIHKIATVLKVKPWDLLSEADSEGVIA